MDKKTLSIIIEVLNWSVQHHANPAKLKELLALRLSVGGDYIKQVDEEIFKTVQFYAEDMEIVSILEKVLDA